MRTSSYLWCATAVAACIVLAFSTRWLSVPFFCPAIAVSFWKPGPRSNIVKTVAWLAAIASLLSPIDICSYGTAMHGGKIGTGVRLVKLQYGLHRPSPLDDDRDEFFNAGCMVPPNPPRWLLVWN